MAVRLATVLPLALLVLGCEDLQDFATVPGESKYAGCVVGNTSDTTFIRSTVFDPGTAMELQLDPDAATQTGPRNAITVIDPDPADERLFDATELRPIAHLSHDALSDYDFPGAGRIRNYLFFATPDTGPLNGRDTTIFVSLMESGRVEVRVIAGRLAPEGEEHFGLFRLARADGSAAIDCTP
jgi:hypothetical protein